MVFSVTIKSTNTFDTQNYIFRAPILCFVINVSSSMYKQNMLSFKIVRRILYDILLIQIIISSVF